MIPYPGSLRLPGSLHYCLCRLADRKNHFSEVLNPFLEPILAFAIALLCSLEALVRSQAARLQNCRVPPPSPRARPDHPHSLFDRIARRTEAWPSSSAMETSPSSQDTMRSPPHGRSQAELGAANTHQGRLGYYFQSRSACYLLHFEGELPNDHVGLGLLFSFERRKSEN